VRAELAQNKLLATANDETFARLTPFIDSVRLSRTRRLYPNATYSL
jgi:hypothetical protein